MRAEIYFSIILIISQAISPHVSAAESGDDFKHLCNPNQTNAHDDDFCNCDLIASPVIGRPAVKIDCMMSDGVTNLTNEVFKAEKLPLNSVTLILSYQLFTSVPFFVGGLVELDMSNNQISVIKEANFAGVKLLETLDLSYNQITEVESNAFSSLTFLHHLDLSNNLIVVMPAHTFDPLVTLKSLKLSSNEGFGRLMGRNTSTSSLVKLYMQLGVTPALKSLELERCNISKINLMNGVGLEHLNLGYNEIVDFTKLELPMNVKKLELSGNPIRELVPYSLSHVYNLNELIMEDMPFLGRVDEYSLYALTKLQRLSLEGSKNLSHFDALAFSAEDEYKLELKVLNLRGCNLRGLNSSFKTIFDGLEELHLEGNPFTCDCDLKWIWEVEVASEILCNRPKEFYERPLSEIDDEKELKCGKMSVFMGKLVNSLILLALLIGCSLAIWCFFRQLSSKSRRKQFQSVGPNSPYQRVTIDANRAEYSMAS